MEAKEIDEIEKALLSLKKKLDHSEDKSYSSSHDPGPKNILEKGLKITEEKCQHPSV